MELVHYWPDCVEEVGAVQRSSGTNEYWHDDDGWCWKKFLEKA